MEQKLRNQIKGFSLRIKALKHELSLYEVILLLSIQQYAYAYTNQIFHASSCNWDLEIKRLKQKYPSIDFEIPNNEAIQHENTFVKIEQDLVIARIECDGLMYSRDRAIHQAIQVIKGVVIPGNYEEEYFCDLDAALANIADPEN